MAANTSKNSIKSESSQGLNESSSEEQCNIGRGITGHQQSSSTSSQQQNPNFDSNVISERVKNLATQIYQELKRIISRCNYDEDILSGLMPLIVRVLESLDLALIENQQLQVELELCKDDNEQLVIMFEKEKAAKRAIDKKLIESEYAYEEERQQYQQKIESLDNVVKMFELKTKNASDQATRFEEKEAERKREYQKLHDRYTELLKSHCDVVERFRHLAGNSEIANLGSINVPQQLVAASSEMTIGDLHSHPLNKLKLTKDDEFTDKASTLRTSGTLKSWNAEAELTLEDASLIVIDDMVGDHHQHQHHHSKSGGDISSHNESDRATVSEPDAEQEKESENDSIAYTSMEKEFRKLIQENKDLLNTKNALNVVKDDLIAEVDRLTNEVSMYEQAVEQLNSVKDQMKQKVSTLDAELRKTKEELEKAKQKIRENNEEGVPYSQRKRFGRAEMAKVLMERNNYKERFMELQDAVRYTELVRANRMETEKRSGLWKFFSNLFGAPPALAPPGKAIMGSPRNSSPVVQLAPGSSAAGSLIGAESAAPATDMLPGASASIRSTNQRLSNNADMIVLMDSDLNVDRSRALGSKGGGRASLAGLGGASAQGGQDLASSGYIHAYGWSLRSSSLGRQLQTGSGGGGDSSPPLAPILGSTSSVLVSSGDLLGPEARLAGIQVPIPQYCRPLTGDSLGMKIWCATAIELGGGDLSKMSLPAIAQAVERAPSLSADTSELSSLEQQRASCAQDSSGSMVNITTSTPVKSQQLQQQALRELEQEVNHALGVTDAARPRGAGDATSGAGGAENRPSLRTTTEMVLNALPCSESAEELSSCVWICSTQHSRSKINIIDIKTKPNELLDSFYVPTFLYCIKSVPGCKPSDLAGLASAASASRCSQPLGVGTARALIDELLASQRAEFYKLHKVAPDAELRLRRGRLLESVQPARSASEQLEEAELSKLQQLEDESKQDELVQRARERHTESARPKQQSAEDEAEISRILDNNLSDGLAKLQKLNDFVAHTRPLDSPKADTTSARVDHQLLDGPDSSGPSANNESSADKSSTFYQPISTHLPTVWMGGKDSVLYVHSAVGQWKDCVACVELHDSILQMCHHRGRVFVSLADGSVCVFFRCAHTKEWDFSQYLSINVGLLAEATSDALGELHAVANYCDSPSSQQVVDAPSGDQSSSSFELDDLHSRLLTTGGARAGDGELSSKNLSPLEHESGPSASPSQRTSTRRRAPKAAPSGVHCLEMSNKNLWLGYRNRVLIFDPINLRLKHTFNVVPQPDNQIRQVVGMKDGVFISLRSDLNLRLYSSLRPYQHIQNIDIEPVVMRLISPKTFVISHITAMRAVDNTLWIGIAHGIILTIPCKLTAQISEAPMRNTSTGLVDHSPSHLSIARFVPKCDPSNAQISFHGHRDAVKFFVHTHQLMLSGGQGYLDFRLDMDDQPRAISDKSHLILWQLPA